MTAPDEPSRKQGHSKLVYDKDRRTIVAVDPSPALIPLKNQMAAVFAAARGNKLGPDGQDAALAAFETLRSLALAQEPLALAPDRAKLVEEIDAFMADAPKGHPHTGYRYGELLQRARAMIAADAAATKAPLPETIKQTVAELREWSKDQRYGYFPGTLKDAANWLESLSRALAEAQATLEAIEMETRDGAQWDREEINECARTAVGMKK